MLNSTVLFKASRLLRLRTPILAGRVRTMAREARIRERLLSRKV